MPISPPLQGTHTFAWSRFSLLGDHRQRRAGVPTDKCTPWQSSVRARSFLPVTPGVTVQVRAVLGVAGPASVGPAGAEPWPEVAEETKREAEEYLR